jgi:hypothetical protein
MPSHVCLSKSLTKLCQQSILKDENMTYAFQVTVHHVVVMEVSESERSLIYLFYRQIVKSYYEKKFCGKKNHLTSIRGGRMVEVMNRISLCLQSAYHEWVVSGGRGTEEFHDVRMSQLFPHIDLLLEDLKE